jgi:16S rRNA (guanine(966)-N(2))-methyltransferase RsmD
VVPPANLKARPTTDFAKEGLFNILNSRICFEGITVLDLFSGTGSIGYEFVSRGVAEAHLVEKNYGNFSGIKKIIGELGLQNIKPIRIDAVAYLKTCRVKYDLVFADPPFNLHWAGELPGMVLRSGVLRENGLFILEHPGGRDFSDMPSFQETRRYGEVHFSFFKQHPGLR